MAEAYAGTGGAPMRINRKKFPRKCECGGKMVYVRMFERVFSHCESCTPAVVIRTKQKKARQK